VIKNFNGSNKIGLICAELQEINEILKLMTEKNEEKAGAFKFILEKIDKINCFVGLSGGRKGACCDLHADLNFKVRS
jgi:hypothetical protein